MQRLTTHPGPPQDDPRPPDGYGCGSAAVGVLIGLFIIAVLLALFGWVAMIPAPAIAILELIRVTETTTCRPTAYETI